MTESPVQTLVMQRLGHHGDGIAAGPSGPVYLPMTLPDETVTARLDGDRGHDLRIVEPSPQRVRPPCRHFRACGGCAVQHASDDYVARWKVDILRQALAAQGLEMGSDLPEPTLHVSPPASRRRAVLSGRRTKSGAIVGFHGRASGTITEIPDCHLLRPELMAVLPLLARITAEGGSRKGELDLAVTLTEAGIDLAVTGAKPADAALAARITALAGDALARITWNDELMAQREEPWLAFGAARAPLPPGAFLQATAEGEAALAGFVMDELGDAARVADLFAGIGTFALRLATRAEVTAVEGDAAMTDALTRGWRSAGGLHQLTAERRDLFRRPLDAEDLARFDAVVLDPPRAGAEAQVSALAGLRPDAGLRHVVYVSCNPTTFARDARKLVLAGWRMRRILLVDQFRWSPHVELAASFERP